ncbi:hypothetical protein BZG36_01083 [Bifiguratus adelaidae]|uniref:rhamnogalacturonan endolyase n=1 Tax=Bifiguratus adelaidae TaxID=1938954 RepID=A0A261Y6F0_9FUNG|nr:hypothetical protein BZG36_01083 [Bifiguratus adelaidae]
MAVWRLWNVLLTLGCFWQLASAQGLFGQLVEKNADPFLWIDPVYRNQSVFGNGLFNIPFGQQYGKKLYFSGQDLVGNATGVYSSFAAGPEVDLNYSTPSIYRQCNDFLDICYSSSQVDVHFVVFRGLAGFYIRNGPLPFFGDILRSKKVQDETFLQPNGSYITKYDWSDFIRTIDYHGVYGDNVGAWVIAPGKDYFIADHLKQELNLHRESSTGDAVLLNMLHGTHFMTMNSSDNLLLPGKMWGPWLVYLNDGSLDDAAARTRQEYKFWPYPWMDDVKYQSRGSVSGRLVLDTGEPASGAAVFLGQPVNGTTMASGGLYQYTTYADNFGNFKFDAVRTEEIYQLVAWSNGSKIGHITSVHNGTVVRVTKGHETKLGQITWRTQQRRNIFQIGDYDRKALGFKYGGAPYYLFLLERWALLTLSLAGYSQAIGINFTMNGQAFGSLPSLPNDQSVYRSATVAGEWRQLTFDITAGLITRGWNTLTFNVTSLQHNTLGTTAKGAMWDAIILDWA